MTASIQPSIPTPLRLALAGGGTGGHLAPGLHLLDWLVEARGLDDVLWLAGDRRVDRRMLADLAARLDGVPARVRSLGIEGGRDAAPSHGTQLVRMPVAFARARRALVEHRSELLLGLGGYVSLPAVLAARSLGIPVVLLEVNAVMGGATRLLSPLAARILHSVQASMPTGAPKDSRHRVSGPPLAPVYTQDDGAAQAEASAFVAALGLDPARPLLLVLGGSQGAGPLNGFVREHLDLLLEGGVQVLHQVGPGRRDEGAADRPGYRAVEFVDPTHRALRASTAVLARAGASSLAEIAALGVPAVLVPYPQASGNHQQLNAAQLGAGVVVLPQAQLDAERASALARLIGEEGAERRTSMAAELRRRVPGDGSARLVVKLEELLGRTIVERAPREVAVPAGGEPLHPALPRRIHLLGVGGAGVSGMARLLVARGHRVSGHDRSPSPALERLAALGIEVRHGDSSADGLPPEAELVVRSAAVPEDDPQVEAARERGIPVLKYAAALGRLAPAGRTLAITGTHGKTTTSWLTLHALRAAVHEPTPGGLIGGVCLDLATNAIPPGPDGWFVVEACEFDHSFLELRPTAAAITNVEADHLDCYGDLQGVIDGFSAFAARVDPGGLLVVGANVPERVERAARCAVWRLGRELIVTPRGQRDGHHAFALAGPGFELDLVVPGVPGRFNVENAALALALAVHAAGPGRAAAAAEGLARFRGAGRRFERWLDEEGLAVVHDYAHHPTEVRATFEAAREVFPDRRLVVLFQPHQYSRTAHFLEEFAAALALADEVLVSDVYGARRPAPGEPSAEAPDLVARIQVAGTAALAAGNLCAATEALAQRLTPPCVAMVIGAGDVESIAHDLLGRLALRGGSQR
ncbi:glycosyltransferase [Engelhardtia mirabilis]|uniref:Multifunctional fusion protein n=1 Tax=Engelhardtia mirabilis TaxID=2528011 RepID=A0A518BIA2_9BACT|nr:UDP-N-acetylmuramate--L-alanine ligase MurC [Planctomycetes bacterium Pla133]QDV01036.1 UDP-N-acetylmuramate--L-alanine ligase MurC [Planctomycetes bacterium Pla86]